MGMKNRGDVKLYWMPRGVGFEVEDQGSPDEPAIRERVLSFCDDVADLFVALVPRSQDTLFGNIELAPPNRPVVKKDIDDKLSSQLPRLDISWRDYLERMEGVTWLEGSGLPRVDSTTPQDADATAVSFAHTDVPYGPYGGPTYRYDPVTGDIVCIYTTGLLINGEPARFSIPGEDGYADVLVQVEFSTSDPGPEN